MLRKEKAPVVDEKVADRLTIDSAQTWPMAAILAAAFCGTASLLPIKRYGNDLHPTALNAPAMLIGGGIAQ